MCTTSVSDDASDFNMMQKIKIKRACMVSYHQHQLEISNGSWVVVNLVACL